MRIELQKFTGIERNLVLREYLVCRHERELRMSGEKSVHDVLVFRAHKAASGINDATAGFDQRRCGRQNSRLLRGEFGNCSFGLAPFQIRITPQSAETAARRIDEDAVDFAAETLYLDVVFI